MTLTAFLSISLCICLSFSDSTSFVYHHAPVRAYVLRMPVCECDLRKCFASTFMSVVSITVTFNAASVLETRRLKDLYTIFTNYNKPSNKEPA